MGVVKALNLLCIILPLPPSGGFSLLAGTSPSSRRYESSFIRLQPQLQDAETQETSSSSTTSLRVDGSLLVIPQNEPSTMETNQPKYLKRSNKKQRPGRKAYKHLFRHYEDVSFDSWLRCSEPMEFLRSVGYTNDELELMVQQMPELQEMNVHGQLAPKVRFLVETLGGGSGTLTWKEDPIPTKNENDDTCSISYEEGSNGHVHSMRLEESTRRMVPPSFFKCQLDRSVGPRHAYLMHNHLPHGRQLLEDHGKLFLEFLNRSSKTDDFVAMCNEWSNTSSTHSKESLDEFEQSFTRGLVIVARDFYQDQHDDEDDNMVELLVQHGGNYMEYDKRTGISTMHWTAGSGNLRGLQALVHVPDHDHDHVVDIMLNEQAPKDGATPFHWACCGITPEGIGLGGTLHIF